jgi:hypothetical protein
MGVQVVKDLVPHAITLIPLEDYATISALARTCREFVPLFTRSITLNAIMSTYDRARRASLPPSQILCTGIKITNASECECDIIERGLPACDRRPSGGHLTCHYRYAFDRLIAWKYYDDVGLISEASYATSRLCVMCRYIVPSIQIRADRIIEYAEQYIAGNWVVIDGTPMHDPGSYYFAAKVARSYRAETIRQSQVRQVIIQWRQSVNALADLKEDDTRADDESRTTQAACP